MGWFVPEETYMTSLDSLGVSGLGDPGQVGAQACAVPVFLVTAVAVTVLCGPVLFLTASYPVPRAAPKPSVAFLVHLGPLFFTGGGVCVSWCPSALSSQCLWARLFPTGLGFLVGWPVGICLELRSANRSQIG